MTSTIKRPTGELAQPPDQTPRPNRLAFIAIVTLAVTSVVLGIIVVYQASNDDNPTAVPEDVLAVPEDVQAVPEDVQAVLDDFTVAVETYDYEAMQALVTDNFRRPFYFGDPTGHSPFRAVDRIEDFDFFEDEAPIYVIERVGAPIVRGDGPWYISVAENWEKPGTGIREEAIYTYAVIVDTDDVLRIDDAYWVGHPVLSDN